jgi:AraC-like DNA-binding protein
MRYRTHIPRPPLSSFVDMVWLYERDAPSHPMERVLPSGTAELIIDLRDDGLALHDREDASNVESFRGALGRGPQAEFFVIDTARPCAIMGVHFKPGGAFPFFRLLWDELANTHVPLEALWRGSAAEPRERLLTAASSEDKFSSLERSLLALLAPPAAGHGAVAAALGHFRGVPQAGKIADLAEAIGLSQRRLTQLFSDEVGLTPKVFCRVLRFQHALRRIGRSPPSDWTNLALACGYYDQAHFNHDFRNFCGLAPTAYLSRRGEHVNHARAASLGQRGQFLTVPRGPTFARMSACRRSPP